MKSFKEISQNIVPLSEGIFDLEGDDRLERGVAKDTMDMFLKTCKGDFKTVSFKDGSVRINGKLIISGTESTKLYLNCKDFHGKLIIENCPKLETFEDSFLEKIAVFDGSITINQCPSLVSVKGLPGLIKGDLSITNCKKLKSCDGIDSVFGNVYWSGNGKKYTVDQLKEKIHVIKKVFCGEEEMDANISEGLISEAFNNQWLQRFAAQLKKYPYKEWSWDDKAPNLYNKVDTLFKQFGRTSSSGRVGRLLDKITNDDIDVYDMGDEKDKKELGKVFYDAYSNENPEGADIFLVYNEDLGEFIGGFGYLTKPRGSGWVIQWVDIPHQGSYKNKMAAGSCYGKAEAREKLLRYGNGFTVVVINSGKNTGNSPDSRYEIRKERVASRQGVINPGDVEQYKKIAAANLKRYKDAVAQLKLARKKNSEAGGYDKLIDKYEQIQLRIIKLVRNVSKDPKAYNKYDLDRFLEWCRDEQRSNPNYKPWARRPQGSPYYGENGLMYYFKYFMSCYMNCFGNSYKSTPDESDYKSLEAAAHNLDVTLERADSRLKKFGV